jgi:perosamine synthetase
MKLKPISISFFPNFEDDDFERAIKLFFLGKKALKNFPVFEKLNECFKNYFGGGFFHFFASGRGALFCILKALKIKKGDEIFVPGFTCNALVNPILALGATPIYIDIDENLNLDPEDLQRKIQKSKRAKAIILQYTFGNFAKVKPIQEIASKYGLILIEDLAQSLGLEIDGKKAGTFGEISFLSFGRDKVISSLSGGASFTFKKEFFLKIEKEYQKFTLPSPLFIKKELFYPILFKIAFPIYFPFGKGILYLARKLNLILPSVFGSEKEGKLALIFCQKMPEVLGFLLYYQFLKLEKFNLHRKTMAQIYRETLKDKFNFIWPKSSIFLRFSLLTKNARNIRKYLKKKNIILDDGWHSQVILPPKTNLTKMLYRKGTCPRAEKLAKKILNLPTHINISEKEQEIIIKELWNLK